MFPFHWVQIHQLNAHTLNFMRKLLFLEEGDDSKLLYSLILMLGNLRSNLTVLIEHRGFEQGTTVNSSTCSQS